MNQKQYQLSDLIRLMQRLRDPDYGCPWDIEQDYKSITASTIEEVYEVVDAIDRGDTRALKEELGDLLFQIIFYCQLASEEDTAEQKFDTNDIVHNLTAKLIRRHPHVFFDGTLDSPPAEKTLQSEQQVKRQWERIKQQERDEKGKVGLFDDVPVALPALNRAAKIQKRAATVGFDWDDITPVFDKLNEEIDELKQAKLEGDKNKIAEEVGDILFTAVNIARKADVSQSRRCVTLRQSLNID